MKNLKIYLPLVDGSVLPIEHTSGKELIQGLVSDDVRPPPRSMVIEATAEDGRRIAITIPYDNRDAAHVRIEDATDAK